MLDGIENTHDIVHINHELHDRRSIFFSSAHLACNVVGQWFECRTRHESPGQSAFRLDAYFTYMFRESSVLFYVVIVCGNITVPEKCITIKVHFILQQFIPFVPVGASSVKYTRILYGTCLNVLWTYPYLHLKNWMWSICVCTQIHNGAFSAQREDLSHNQESRCIYTDQIEYMKRYFRYDFSF